jgi:hypothetical protein
MNDLNKTSLVSDVQDLLNKYKASKSEVSIFTGIVSKKTDGGQFTWSTSWVANSKEDLEKDLSNDIINSSIKIANVLTSPNVHQYLQSLILQQNFELDEKLKLQLKDVGLIEMNDQGQFRIKETGRLLILAYYSLVSACLKH